MVSAPFDRATQQEKTGARSRGAGNHGTDLAELDAGNLHGCGPLPLGTAAPKRYAMQAELLARDPELVFPFRGGDRLGKRRRRFWGHR